MHESAQRFYKYSRGCSADFKGVLGSFKGIGFGGISMGLMTSAGGF